MLFMSVRTAELDLDEARRRLSVAAAEAKRLEVTGDGHAANAVWTRYQLISDAIDAQERVERIARRRSVGSR